MKNIFKEYINLSDEKKDSMWSESIFVFDTNLLLNLYRYSKKTREALLKALNNLNERIWLPYHVVEEYHKNRCEIIYETINKYDKIEKDAAKFANDCQGTFRLQDEEVDEFRAFVEKWLVKVKKDNLLVSSPTDDKILDELLVLFDGKVGKNFEQKVLDTIKIEGITRYDSKVPPGYMDAKKINGAYDNNMFGDLIIWKQILEYSKEFGKDIIYVTNDQKEDWWYITHGKTIGPRYELKKEFHDYTGKEFHMYSMDGFLARADMNTDISILEEVKNIEVESYHECINSTIDINSTFFFNNLKKFNDVNRKIYTNDWIEFNHLFVSKVLENKIDKLRKQIAALTQLEKKYHQKEIPGDIKQQMNEINKSINKTKNEINGLINKGKIV